MKADLKTQMVPFPSGLMSTARAPAVMPASFAAEVRNMLLLADGAGTKRNGFVAHGPALTGEVIGRMFGFVAEDGSDQIVALTQSGKLMLLEDASWSELYDGLDGDALMCGEVFGGELVLGNGVDPLLRWDGATLSEVSQKVTDPSAGLAYVNATTFTIESEEGLYPVGSEVEAVLDTGTVTANVASVSESGGVVTVVLDAGVLDATLASVAYTAAPPRFARLVAAHDRLWGFGAADATVGERARVFFTQGFNDPAAWFDDEGNLAYVNLADKSGGLDTLRGMAVKDGMTVFLLGQTTQLWTGRDPRPEGDFAWSKTLPVGVVHGELVAELPNDVLFVSPNGVRTLSRALQTEQLDIADVGGELDPTWQGLVRWLAADPARAATLGRVRHEGQGWFAFKLGGEVPVLQVTGKGFGWVAFDGLFAQADAFGEGLDGAVYAAVGGQIYAYDEDVFDDAGESFVARWVTPWLGNRTGKRWANAYLEVLCEAGVAQPLTLTRYWNDDPGQGVVHATESTNAPDHWDTADWDEARWDNGRLVAPLVRDPFVAQVVRFAIENESDGALTLFGIQLYGIPERG